MKDRRLQKLRRKELLEMLLELERENEQLAQENRQLREQLADHERAMRDAATFAEAFLRFGGVFSAAQDAANSYLKNVRRITSDESRTSSKTSEEAVHKGP